MSGDFEYRLLDEDQRHAMRTHKLVELETEHYRLSLDIALAESAGIDTPPLREAKAQLEMLAAQITTLAEVT